MLNLRSQFEHYDDPYELHIARDLLGASQLRRLCDGVPAGLSRFERTDKNSEKQYAMKVLYLVEDNAKAASLPLNADWRELLRDLQSEAFVDWIEAGVGLRLRHLATDIGIYVHEAGDYISVHKDKPHKALTAVLYLNEHWPDDGGGNYEVRRSSAPHETPVRIFPPHGGRLLAFPPGERSWHAVSMVGARNKSARLTVQLEYWTEKKPR